MHILLSNCCIKFL